ncbi:MAG TPA: hypothetical protein VFD46_07050 [Chryseolinea sp.]|nr:hypothetical protein [Chryseolinea sp.]
MTPFYHKTKFWVMVRNSLTIFTGPAVLGMHEMGSADVWLRTAGAIGWAGTLLTIWFVDSDNNGTVDLFE